MSAREPDLRIEPMAEPVVLPADARPTLERFLELRSRSNDLLTAHEARSILRELKAVGGNLRQLRLALTGRDRGPALWEVVAALPREEALRRTAVTLAACASTTR